MIEFFKWRNVAHGFLSSWEFTGRVEVGISTVVLAGIPEKGPSRTAKFIPILVEQDRRDMCSGRD